MNGATAVPCARMIRPPNTSSINRIGVSQYFLRTRKNAHSSARIDMMGPGSLDLMSGAILNPIAGRRPRRQRATIAGAVQRCACRSADAFQDAHIVRDRGAAHVEQAAEPRVSDLEIAGRAGELHGA